MNPTKQVTEEGINIINYIACLFTDKKVISLELMTNLSSFELKTHKAYVGIRFRGLGSNVFQDVSKSPCKNNGAFNMDSTKNISELKSYIMCKIKVTKRKQFKS